VPDFDRDELRAALSMTGPALRRAGRYDIDHEIAVTLQRSQLTVPTVEIPGIAWSARYRSGSPGVAGGDWYDVIALEGERVAVAIGDIVGKGVQAAAAMGQLRSATRALANRVDDPAHLLEALDDYVRATGQGLFSSLALVVIDAAAGAAQLAVAGHPPPLHCTQAKRASLIETGRGPLLGVDAERSNATIVLAPGDLLVLYTDGLVERRDRSLNDGLDLLVRAVETGIMEPSQLCRAVMDELADDTADDDIAIVAVQLARE
jgi:serine phosphatase RsbU (regulator of sigma subunit)